MRYTIKNLTLPNDTIGKVGIVDTIENRILCICTSINDASNLLVILNVSTLGSLRALMYTELLNSRSFNDNPERLAAIATTVLSEHEEIDVIIWNENLQKFEVKK